MHYIGQTISHKFSVLLTILSNAPKDESTNLEEAFKNSSLGSKTVKIESPLFQNNGSIKGRYLSYTFSSYIHSDMLYASAFSSLYINYFPRSSNNIAQIPWQADDLWVINPCMYYVNRPCPSPNFSFD